MNNNDTVRYGFVCLKESGSKEVKGCEFKYHLESVAIDKMDNEFSSDIDVYVYSFREEDLSQKEIAYLMKLFGAFAIIEESVQFVTPVQNSNFKYED